MKRVGREKEFWKRGETDLRLDQLMPTMLRLSKHGLSKWLSRDPKEEQGGLNLYGMVGNDAINRFDPLGLMTLQQMEDAIARLKRKVEAQNWKCCCNKSKMVLSAYLQSVTVSGETATVAAHIRTSQGDCPLEVVDYYWWNCFRAHNEAWNAGVRPKSVNDEKWKEYGWELGDKTDTHRRGRCVTLEYKAPRSSLCAPVPHPTSEFRFNQLEKVRES